MEYPNMAFSRYTLRVEPTFKRLTVEEHQLPKTSLLPEGFTISALYSYDSDIRIPGEPSYASILQNLADRFGGTDATLALLADADLWTVNRD